MRDPIKKLFQRKDFQKIMIKVNIEDLQIMKPGLENLFLKTMRDLIKKLFQRKDLLILNLKIHLIQILIKDLHQETKVVLIKKPLLVKNQLTLLRQRLQEKEGNNYLVQQ